MKLLLVDDSDGFAAQLEAELRRCGYAVTRAATYAQAETARRRSAPDMILLDLMLPDGSGLELLRELRATGDRVPVIVTTARDGGRERVLGLQLGADDYVVKPFWTEELLARIRAVMRRIQPADHAADVVQFGDLVVDLPREDARVAGASCRLTPTEWALLYAFVRRPRQPLRRERLIEQVLPGQRASDEALSAHVSRLRAKLGTEGWRVQTVWGIGYRFEPGGEV